MLGLAYLLAGYWAAGVILYSNKAAKRVGTPLFYSKLITGILLGVVLIPAAILERLGIYSIKGRIFKCKKAVSIFSQLSSVKKSPGPSSNHRGQDGKSIEFQ